MVDVPSFALLPLDVPERPSLCQGQRHRSLSLPGRQSQWPREPRDLRRALADLALCRSENWENPPENSDFTRKTIRKP